MLHLRLPEFHGRVLATGLMGRCPHGAGAHTQLQGVEADGKTFRTARCKIYPSGLNQALAEAIVSHTKRVYAGAHIETGLPEDLHPYRHVDFVEEGTVQPDYYHLNVQS